MFDSIKIPNSLKDIFKIIVGVKILSFILISAIESYEDIKEIRDTNDCVEHMSEKYTSDEMQSPLEAKANAIHFCNGGVKDSLSKKS
tara:strand:+ start:1580 stop:1840 length:261 start_codon:yes stop_codon:yes gene_type:complete